MKKPNLKQVIESLKFENINTWFDLGLFIDKFKDEVSNSNFTGSFSDYKTYLNRGGMGFISFHFTVDGITVEVEKYAKIFKNQYPNIDIHYIAGNIYDEATEMIDSSYKTKVIPEIDGFDNWPLYNDFFRIKMERGSKEYNALISKFWNEVLVIVEKLGTYIEENNINLLYLVNVCSNPGNVSLSLATVLISEYLGIPVINNNHDFYWEGGNRDVEIEAKGLEKGPRDFFYHNSHVGEFFSTIEVLFPWSSRSWMNVNINNIQKTHLIEKNGLNPANVELIGTAVDENLHKQMSKRDIIKAFMQVSTIFANEKETITVHKVDRHVGSERSLRPILFGCDTIKNFDFVNNNIVFLQPTRVISRKNIETNFILVRKLFSNNEFTQKFIENPELTISLIVTGPIPLGQQGYYEKLIAYFSDFLKTLPNEFKPRVLLGFLFSEFDKYEFRKKFDSPIDIKQLYNVASLILLPSQTEGRGLPIIEAAATGTPIFCRQYDPRTVFEEVIGYNLSEENRLRVLEFRGDRIPEKLINKIINHVFYPQNSLIDVEHNHSVISKRYSIASLGNDIDRIIYKQYLQLNSINNNSKILTKLTDKYNNLVNFRNNDLKEILNTETRHYMPGYNRYAFMIYLKSLIDPSFFRVEEQFNRGEIFSYAKFIDEVFDIPKDSSVEKYHEFFNIVEDIFKYHDGDVELRHDHSLAYRHRNKVHFPYQDYTYQELTGLVNMIYYEVLKPKSRKNIVLAPQFFTDWNLALFQLTNSKSLGIDNREILTYKLKTNVPKAYFSGRYIKHELEYFVLQPIRVLLGLSIEEELTQEHIKNAKEEIQKVYIFIHEPSITEWFSNKEIEEYLKSGTEPGLTILYNAGIVQTVATKQWSNGVHFPQMGADAIKVLRKIKEADGFIITNGEYAAMMTDILNIDHFHIGKAERKMTAKIMGIPHNSGFIQYVPAGVRTTLAYPTPIQTSKQFDQALNSNLFKELSQKLGEKELYNRLRIDAEQNGTPILKFLNSLKEELSGTAKTEKVKSQFVGGVYPDGLPWSGVSAEIDTNEFKWQFSAHFAKNEPKNVPDLINEYKAETGFNKKVEFAWNGGYILNPELVGKLGLPETYIGSPLGLLIMETEVKCPPLFNKPAFIIYKNGNVDIQKVNSKNGFVISNNNESLEFTSKFYNTYSNTNACYYDLTLPEETVQANGNVIVRIAGNTVKQILHTKASEEVKIIPVGITLSIPKEQFSNKIFIEEKEVKIEMLNSPDSNIDWNNISYAIEAGPMLLENGELAVDMITEGWKTKNSIKTQAARIDFIDMRGPKIAVGIDNSGKLKVLMVNGRIRESVGATHFDMANILKENGMQTAMGFDPGGSSTLVVDGKILNISPYNKNYEKDIYSLSPEPRFVSNIIMGYI